MFWLFEFLFGQCTVHVYLLIDLSIYYSIDAFQNFHTYLFFHLFLVRGLVLTSIESKLQK